jgi:NhaP-type Na+/H+ or K+/H+ antiporter
LIQPLANVSIYEILSGSGGKQGDVFTQNVFSLQKLRTAVTMAENLLIGIATIIVLGVGAQWIAWRLGLPSILLLLICGFIAGPATGFINPDRLFGDLLLPIVSVSVAVILFEGGLNLKFSELRDIKKTVLSLVTIGVLISWVASAAAAYYLFDIDYRIAVLLGAILVVTGPTVIIPLLRDIKPAGKVGSIIKWEGIVIDPIGAFLAVLVFEAILAGGVEKATQSVGVNVIKSLLTGGVAGFSAAQFLIFILRKRWVPDFLQNGVSLMTVIAAFAISNYVQSESGLITVTVMGVLLANQRYVDVKHIMEFKETLRVLFIASLFIILAARFTAEEVTNVADVWSLLFLGVLFFVARPLSVFLSTFGSGLNLREKVFLSWMAPRGIVAAAVSSVFALKLAQAGIGQAEYLVDITFLVITASVTVYGITAYPLAKYLGIARPYPQGILILGAHGWARAIAKFLHEEGFLVAVVDSNWSNVAAARQQGLQGYYENILQEEVQENIDFDGMGKLLALTPNDEVNSLAALHFVEYFGRSHVYQLPRQSRTKAVSEETIPKHLSGRLLFTPEATFSNLSKRFGSGAVIKKTPLTAEFGFEAFKKLYGDKAMPMFVIKESGELIIFAHDNPPVPQPGQQIVALINNSNVG